MHHDWDNSLTFLKWRCRYKPLKLCERRFQLNTALAYEKSHFILGFKNGYIMNEILQPEEKID